jgi:uncharacterized protein YecA (UPF0149 family)
MAQDYVRAYDLARQELVSRSLPVDADDQYRRLASAFAGKSGRNAPCPCGSGLKFKKCHGRES